MSKERVYYIFENQYGLNKKAEKRRQSLIYTLFKPFETHRLEKVSSLIPPGSFSVLEIGCGDGQFLYDNRGRWKDIIGVDVVKQLLEKAKKREYGGRVKFQLADFGREFMPYKSYSFDIVISISTLQYVYDLDLIFSEIYRVLKKGGLFIFEVPNAAIFWRRVMFLLGKLPRTSQYLYGWDAGVIHYFTHYDLTKFIMSKKYTIEKVSCSGIFDNLRQYWPSMFGGDLIYVCRK